MRIGTLKEPSTADAALFDSRTQPAWLAVAAALLVLFPFMASDYWLYLACLVSINVASATGLNILTGYTGLVSLGQAAFMGLGAYTVAILQAKVGSPFLLNILAGGTLSPPVPPVNFQLAKMKCAMNDAAMVAIARYSPFTRSEGMPTTIPPSMATNPPASRLNTKGVPTLVSSTATV